MATKNPRSASVNWFGPKGLPGGLTDVVAPRCAACNTPVRPGKNDPCKCFPVTSKK